VRRARRAQRAQRVRRARRVRRVREGAGRAHGRHGAVAVLRDVRAARGGDDRRGAHQVRVHRHRRGLFRLRIAGLVHLGLLRRDPPRVSLGHERGAEGGVVDAPATVRSPVRAGAESILEQHRRAHTLRVHAVWHRPKATREQVLAKTHSRYGRSEVSTPRRRRDGRALEFIRCP